MKDFYKNDNQPPGGSDGLFEDREQLISAILASDLAAEVDAEFKGRRSAGFDVPAATQHVFGGFHAALSSAQDGPVVILALAALQLRADQLQTVIRDAALTLIDSGEALAAYLSEDFNERKRARQILEQFERALTMAETTEGE